MKRNKKIYFYITLILIVSVMTIVLTYSYSWFLPNILSNKNLDYIIYSDSVVFLDFSSNETFSKLVEAQAVEGAVAAGQPLGNIFTGTTLENIARNAEIGAIEVDLAYYGQSGSSNLLKINGSVSVDIDGTIHDIGSDVSYLVCAYSDRFSMSENWRMTQIPGNCWLNDNGNGYLNFTLNVEKDYYLLLTNASHEELLDFGINNYLKVCEYDNITEAFVFDSAYAEYATDSAFKIEVAAAIAANKDSFVFNAFEFVISEPEGSVYTIYEDTKSPEVVVNEELQLKFLILIWYNKVDELLDPAIVRAKGMVLSVSVGATTNE